jgi:hypothetical protein
MYNKSTKDGEEDEQEEEIVLTARGIVLDTTNLTVKPESFSKKYCASSVLSIGADNRTGRH